MSGEQILDFIDAFHQLCQAIPIGLDIAVLIIKPTGSGAASAADHIAADIVTGKEIAVFLSRYMA